jgi:hypothetical protein
VICSWPEGCAQEALGNELCYFHTKAAQRLIWPTDMELELQERRDRERDARVRKAMAVMDEPVSDAASDPPTAYLVIVPVSEACYAAGHSLNRYPDAVTCSDCETVAATAAVDGVDVDAALLAFRAWSLEQEVTRGGGT